MQLRNGGNAFRATYSKFGVVIDAKGNSTPFFVCNYGGIFSSGSVKPLPSHLNHYAKALEAEFIQEIPDGKAILSSAILHFWNKFFNFPLSGSDINNFIIEFIIKTILSEQLSVRKTLMTLIQVKNARLEQNTQKESFEHNLRFSFNSASLF